MNIVIQKVMWSMKKKKGIDKTVNGDGVPRLNLMHLYLGGTDNELGLRKMIMNPFPWELNKMEWMKAVILYAFILQVLFWVWLYSFTIMRFKHILMYNHGLVILFAM